MIENHPLYYDVKPIIDNRKGHQTFGFNAFIHTPKEKFEVIKILNIDYVDNFMGAYSSIVTMEAVFGLGTFYKDIYPYKDKLEISIVKGIYTDGNGIPEIQEEVYTGIIVTEGNKIGTNETIDMFDKYSLDTLDLITIKFQLLNKTVEKLRTIQVGGSFRKTTPTELCRSLITDKLTELEVDERDTIVGVDMIEGDNTEEREQFVIPHGTMIYDVPGYIQRKEGGIYKTGIGAYFLRNNFYIFPLFDLERFNSCPKTLDVIMVPVKMLPVPEISWKTFGSVTLVVASGPRNQEDKSEVSKKENGTGVRFSKIKDFFSDFVKVADNKVTASRKDNSAEFVNMFGKTQQEADNSTQIENAPMSSERITANPYNEMSKISVRGGSFFTVIWENSNPDLIYPGMMVRLKYAEGKEIRIAEGCLVFAQHAILKDGRGLVGNSHRINTSLTIFTTSDIDLKEE